MTGDFRGIVEGARAVHEVCRDEHHVAFLAERPVRPGHVVVCTVEVVDSVFDLTPEASARLWSFVHELGVRMRARLPCERVCLSVIGWAVRHAHVHLIPTDAAGEVPGLDGAPLSAAAAQAVLQRLRG